MDRDTVGRITQLIDERIIRLKREIADMIGRGIVDPAFNCGCNFDKGCCGDKACCGDKGCCQDKKSFDPEWNELIRFGDRIGVPISELIDRIQKLDPKLIGGR